MRGKEEKKEREDMRGDESRCKEKTEGRADKAGEGEENCYHSSSASYLSTKLQVTLLFFRFH